MALQVSHSIFGYTLRFLCFALLRAQVSPDAKHLVKMLLEKDPEKRPTARKPCPPPACIISLFTRKTVKRPYHGLHDALSSTPSTPTSSGVGVKGCAAMA